MPACYRYHLDQMYKLFAIPLDVLVKANVPRVNKPGLLVALLRKLSGIGPRTRLHADFYHVPFRCYDGTICDG